MKRITYHCFDWRIIFSLTVVIVLCSSICGDEDNPYYSTYISELNTFANAQDELITDIEKLDVISEADAIAITRKISAVRLHMKSIDFLLRYLDPIAYKKINGPLPVEWETEVFEKFEKPYKRDGAGLTLAELYLQETSIEKNKLLDLLIQSQSALKTYQSDSIVNLLHAPDHFFFANRLFLLNLAAIYTSGFECPETGNTIPELEHMLKSVRSFYEVHNASHKEKIIPIEYLNVYDRMIAFVSTQHKLPEKFDHFTFIRDHVNPLFAKNQQFIRDYALETHSFLDYSLNDASESIFSKNLYTGQNRKGIFIAIDDPKKLAEIAEVGKLLFYDPILSGNGKRSCANCHRPDAYFTDTTTTTNLRMDGKTSIDRNSPSLVNVVHNHLLMLDGKHFTLQNQAKDVLTNPLEMGGNKEEIVEAILSCRQYKKAFERFANWTPAYREVSIDHIVSALTLFYSSFSDFSAPFDLAMNHSTTLSEESIAGFNIFMSKAACATCHFAPQFNGVKPPYVGSEFEVLGVPEDNAFTHVSNDGGRFDINPAIETQHAFRTGSIRNSTYTAPYMHNGIFRSMDEVIDFYNCGGGAGRGLDVKNQTLAADSLHLTTMEIKNLKAFLKTLDEEISFPIPPQKLPESTLEKFAGRKVGGEY